MAHAASFAVFTIPWQVTCAALSGTTEQQAERSRQLVPAPWLEVELELHAQAVRTETDVIAASRIEWRRRMGER